MMRRSDSRVVRTRARVLAAARSLIAERGVEAVNVQAVAHRAGASRMTIYRLWGELPALVQDALAATTDEPSIHSPSIGLRDQLVDIYTGLAERLSDAERGPLLAAHLAAAARDPAVGDPYRAFVAERRRQVLAILAAGVDQGEISPEADLELAVDLLSAPLFYRRIVSGYPIDPVDYVPRLVDTVLAGLREPGN
jgi:AcrR family transcriptional regulator